MSEWVMRDWRVAPRTRYAMAFVGAALVVSSMILGASMMAVPTEGYYEDEHILLVADSRLLAVEALWVDPPRVGYRNILDDLPDVGETRLHYVKPTTDPTVRWMVRSYFELEAERKEVLQSGRGTWIDPEVLRDDIDEAFGRFAWSGSYSAWELRFNGTMVHFGSDAVEDPDLIPETCWTVSHDYSGEIGWPSRDDTVPFHAKLVFHLWFETEEPSF